MDLKEVGCDARNWMDLAQYRDQWRAYVSSEMNLRILSAETAVAMAVPIENPADSQWAIFIN